MKKIILLLIISLFASCKTKKTAPVTIYSNVIDTVVIEKEVFNNTEISKAIKDSMFLVINDIKTQNKVFDSLCNNEVARLLKQINFSKKSGDNSYSVVYDQLKKQIEITAEMQEVINKQDSIYFSKNTSKIEYKEVPVEVPVYTNILTKWQKILIGLGIGFPLFFIVRLIIKLKS